MISNQQCRPFDKRFVQFATSEDQKRIYEAYGKNGSIINATARALKKDPSRISQVVRLIQEKAKNTFEVQVLNPDTKLIETRPNKILIFDIETAPKIAHVWGFYNQNISANQVMADMRIMSFAAKWLGDSEIYYEDCRVDDDKAIIKSLVRFLDEADIVVAHNGRAFDVKTVKGRALLHGLTPPSPFKVVDTLLVARSEFKLSRNTLDFIAKSLGVGGKLHKRKFAGHELWDQCLKGNDEAWAEMRAYNIKDVAILEDVYLKMRPWMKGHPNLGILRDEDRTICPKCGSGEIKWRGHTTTNTAVYRKFQCTNCRGWGRTRRSGLDKEKGKLLSVNAG